MAQPSLQSLSRYAALVFLLGNATLARLHAHCLTTGEDAYDVVADAVALHLDEADRDAAIAEALAHNAETDAIAGVAESAGSGP